MLCLTVVPLESDTLERLIPDVLETDDEVARETLDLHLERYEFAARHATPGRSLDIACGVGYGTRLLADRCPALQEVIGVDISADAIEYARGRYADERATFTLQSAMEFEDRAGFDTIVSLETIEHLPDPFGFVANVLPQLRPAGTFVASVPTTMSTDANPHHLHDFSEASFRRMVAPYGLREVACLRQVQPVPLSAVLRRNASRTRKMRDDLPRYYLQHPGALARRIWTTARHGFNNLYITIAWRAPA
jgi:2-polyprenyl-3-methyl-5-hydroxy-6-metoxy-1,4-benzoquinol methylase